MHGFLAGQLSIKLAMHAFRAGQDDAGHGAAGREARVGTDGAGARA